MQAAVRGALQRFINENKGSTRQKCAYVVTWLTPTGTVRREMVLAKTLAGAEKVHRNLWRALIPHEVVQGCIFRDGWSGIHSVIDCRGGTLRKRKIVKCRYSRLLPKRLRGMG